MRIDRLRLIDILEAIQRIESYAIQGKAHFEKQELVQVWMVHHLEIIGEAASKLSKEFCQQHAEISWQKIIGMRNILIHQYFGIDLNEVWRTIELDLPVIKAQISKILAALPPE